MTSPRRNVVVALSAAAFLALLEIFRSGLTRILEGHPEGIFDLVHWVVPLWFSVVLVSPWCAWMAWRFPVRSGKLVRTLLAHLVGAAVFVGLHLLVILLFHHLLAPADIPNGPRLLHSYVFYIGMEVSVYAAIVVVVLLLEARREAAERTLVAARLERSLAAARLESLQAQIRPHFLFNTLNALAVLARRGDGAAVDRAIGDLGELLRATFDAPGRHEITLGEELELVDRYLSLQRIRFPDRLRVEFSVEPATRSARVPALLVQPLVENAIEHGLTTADGGRLQVSAVRQGGQLVIEVRDDGPGFSATRAAGDASAGVGLANTRERLALLHGAAATLECLDAAEGGGVVRITLPWRTAAEGPA
jgi:signal transduction histidine kinase